MSKPEIKDASRKPEISELLRLARAIQRIFGNLEMDQLESTDRRVIAAAAADLAESARRVKHVRTRR